MSPETALLLLGLLDHVALAVNLAPRVKKDYDELSFKIRQMVAADRDPTDVEWRDVGKKLDAASARIKNAAALLAE